VFFLHERGVKMSIYTFFLAAGSSTGPIINGWVGQKLSLEWFWWLCAIASGVNLLAAFFFLPESSYVRDFFVDPEEELHPIPRDSTYPPRKLDNGPGMTFWKIISFKAPPQPISALPKVFLRPFPFIAVPAVFWAVILYGNILAWVVAADVQKSVFFPQPPYLFSLGITGTTSVASILGIACGALSGGYICDLVAARYTRRNNGIHEPEHRLPALIPAAIASPLGCIIFGMCFYHSTVWVGPVAGMFFINFAIACGPNVALTYVVDAYLPWAGEAMVTVNALKNLVAFGMSYGAIPWLQSAGWDKMWGAACGISAAVMISSLPVYFFGKSARQMTGGWGFLKM
jgi:Major Facilitator Superfamily